MRELDDEALGWFGRRLPWGSYGMLARASISAPRWAWRWRAGAATTGCSRTMSRWSWCATANWPAAPAGKARLGPVREFCMVSVLRNIHGLASWLIDARLPLLHASFPFAARRMPMSTRCCSPAHRF
jgi:hypothetical protein